MTDAIQDAVDRAQRYSPFLRGIVRRRPDWPRALMDEGPDAFLAPALAAPFHGTEEEIRGRRQRTAFGAAIADLSGVYDLTAVVRALSDFADLAIDWAVRTAISERIPGARPEGFVALALGKLGSRELNYSSDVDLLYLFDGDRLPMRSGDDPAEAANRIARRISELLQRRTAHGYVARVDLRLRPDAEAFGIATPVRRAEIYYQGEALTWERAAFIRARPVAGDIAMGEQFLRTIQPFIWRRSLDYTAVQAIEDVSLRIRDHAKGPERFGPGFDLKRGRGGIREIEFFAQAHQLIFGGRDESLRMPETRAALIALSAGRRIQVEDAAELSATYEALRNAEHRLQMVDDEQTHSIPARKEEREALAGLAGCSSFAAFAEPLLPRIEHAAARYEAFTSSAAHPAVPRGKALASWLREQRLAAPKELATLIAKWREGAYRSLRSDPAQRELENALPVLAEAFGHLTAPHNALRRFDDMLSRMTSAVRFLALTTANPGIANLLARVMGHAPMLAGKLARRPELLDVLIGADLDHGASAADYRKQAERHVARSGDLEEALDAIRRWSGEQRFRIGVSLLERRIDPLDGARAYSDIADAALVALMPAVELAMAAQHGKLPGGAVPIVLAFGRYGGRLLTDQSDLDLVFLFSGEHDAPSDGEKPIGATTYFNRLFQRFVSAVTVPTAAGPLYEVDTRLRPSGSDGLLAVSVDTFTDYQRQRAWAWEHMALTRARLVLGDAAAQEVFTGIEAGLYQERDAGELMRRVIDMRADMDRAHPQSGPLDVKRGRGGLIDLEFIVHYLQLSMQTGFNPDLRLAIDALASAGLLSGEMGEAHDLLARFLVLSRLVGDEAEGRNSAMTRAMVAEACHRAGWDDMKAAIGDARRTIAAEWKRIFGEAKT
ncbi:bifunctional [glutamate--ammonia ligase]-adenylyl-L-tyrosine phosphorylase/[glutamate--ammonia-ligase] adenylyltransferase [Pacificimonas flava]|uniref:Glutamate-ammonia-ligase adenylyltransferase n=1 Tax=Pacificimonas flava TaxID=1234595 RepID=M2TMG4_9SPHN|nr:bifunctional [glutamate--ammonia ligase]-adenylyl-L-tyrosine phosphorylase/[glutamate--ammonia-ligase] adenylyltransferase [Pacificimonas flava]EMD82911.1 Glutamate-ammonia-ligase adenylyltransferase [Pacificimonas flava]MBB5280073.1 glutamate-ammonia-ligase adenylyltransferase [Pacificimonas flava]